MDYAKSLRRCFISMPFLLATKFYTSRHFFGQEMDAKSMKMYASENFLVRWIFIRMNIYDDKKVYNSYEVKFQTINI